MGARYCVWKEVSLFLNKAYLCIHIFCYKCCMLNILSYTFHSLSLSQFVVAPRKSLDVSFTRENRIKNICDIPLFLVPFFVFVVRCCCLFYCCCFFSTLVVAFALFFIFLDTLRSCKMTWYKNLDGIFHKINAEILLTHKKSTAFFPLYARFSQSFFISDMTLYEKERKKLW